MCVHAPHATRHLQGASGTLHATCASWVGVGGAGAEVAGDGCPALGVCRALHGFAGVVDGALAGLGQGLALHLVAAQRLLALVELGHDDSQGQVQQDEGADEDERHPVQERPRVEGVLRLIHHEHPAFQGDGLENRHEGHEDVVKARHVVVGGVLQHATEGVRRACVHAATQPVVIGVQLASGDEEAALVHDTHPQLQPDDAEDDEVEENDQQSVAQEGDGVQEGVHEHLQAL